MRVDKKCEQRKRDLRRSVIRERESREGVRVEKECEVKRSASREGMRT